MIPHRLFLAIGLDEDTARALDAHLAADTTPRLPGVSMSGRWHITLRFLGPTTELQRDKLLADLSTRALPEPFSVGFGELGAFDRPTHASVAWLGFVRGQRRLKELAQLCEQTAIAVGFDPTDRPFVPHLTLSRIRPRVDISEVMRVFPAFLRTMAVREIELLESQFVAGAIRYTLVDTVPLG